MGHSVTLGGERVGSGSKSKVYLRNYERSTHNLSYDWLNTMGCGMLIPFMCELVTRDDKYEINLKAGLRTIPTKGPLFGSFKMQLDVYKCPLRLYQALLHNNPLAIGLKANQVKFPKIRLYDTSIANEIIESKAANNSLIKYLGISGMGSMDNEGITDEIVHRDFFGAHVLAYYDIFKNYYANKQEEFAYTIRKTKVKDKSYNLLSRTAPVRVQDSDNYYTRIFYGTDVVGSDIKVFYDDTDTLVYNTGAQLAITFQFENINELSIDDLYNNNILIQYENLSESQELRFEGTIKKAIEDGYIINVIKNEQNPNLLSFIFNAATYKGQYVVSISQIGIEDKLYSWNDEISLLPFYISNIDTMRYDILSFHRLGESFILDGAESINDPYLSAIGNNENYYWKNPLAGICVKTYQSDIFNNWLNTEIIDGENGISEITAISTSSGSITIDQLQFSEKLYNLLNRIAVSGGTYQDYLDAAYTASAKRFEESPIWIGGMSDEVIFEEIVQTAPSGDTKLGTLGGRGNLLGKKKGGKITVKIDEPSLLIGIVSITPRIVYTQGNKWFNTEIDSLQDIHVPALDAIGFQNLIGETMHYGSTIINTDSTIQDRPIIGKIPAWLHYMTNYDQAYGDFAATDGDGYMVLNRNYECKNGILQDATTYIDPAKYNYAFVYAKRDAQNFWVKIRCNIKARRLMSAKQIPTA